MSVSNEEKQNTGISLLLSESTKGPPGLISPCDGQMTTNGTYTFITNTLRRDLGFNPVYFRAETAIEVLSHNPS